MAFNADPKPIELRADLKGLALNEEKFVALLRDLISESKHVQNAPSMGIVPQEGCVAKHVLAALAPHSTEQGGPLKIQVLEYVENRPNVKITYAGTGEGTVGLVGSHMDVVPANPETWQRDPFQLTVEGDKLYGRGTTDCLGHVAMLTQLLIDLAVAKPALEKSLVVLLIAGEEGSEHGVGVDQVVERGEIDELKGGPVFWVDSADSQPCLGTAGALQWHLKANGRLFHSGLPHRGINSLELVMEAMAEIQKRFYRDHPPHPREVRSFVRPCNTVCGCGEGRPWRCCVRDALVVRVQYTVLQQYSLASAMVLLFWRCAGWWCRGVDDDNSH
jgi:acetylornithine deacetylase